MAQLNKCNFMVDGYHYPKVCSPTRTDSCRLYIDTEKDGEESNVRYVFPKKMKYHVVSHVDSSEGIFNADAYLEEYTVPEDGEYTFYNLYNKDGTIAKTIGTNITDPEVERFAEDLYLTIDDEGNFYFRVGPGAAPFNSRTGTFTQEYWSGDEITTTATTTITKANIKDTWFAPTTATMENKKMHLKGIHGFQVQK